jgi:hypothetical protein
MLGVGGLILAVALRPRHVHALEGELSPAVAGA